jgi:hypothetical protein
MRNFTNKKLSLFGLASLLLVSFCLLPCGGAAAMAARSGHVHDKSHKEMGSMDHAGMEAHSRHGGDKGALHVNGDAKTASCQHCNISAPAILKDTKVPGCTAFDLPKNEGSDNLLLSSTGGLLKLDLPPPRHKNPIHIINSIYII